MQTTSTCKVSFITVNYNGKEDTAALLTSIALARLSFAYEVIVVDNASVADEFAWLKERYPTIKGCRSLRNLGFAGGNNLGIELSSGEYIYFINNDTLLPGDADEQIQSMISFCATTDQIGGLSPKIMYFDPPGLLQFAGCTPLTAITLRNKQIGYREKDVGQYNLVKEIPYLHGAAMFIPRHVIQHIGPMPELFFLYYEEVDWCYQISKYYNLYYYPQAYIYHKESASTGIDSPLKTFYLTRNRLLFAFRNRTGIQRLLSIFYIATVASSLKMLRFIVKGKWQQAASVWSGMRSGFLLFRAK